MQDDETLLLNLHALSKVGQGPAVLLILSQISQPAKPLDIRAKGTEVGFRAVTQWNVSAILKAAATKGLVAQLTQGWKLLKLGQEAISEYYNPEAPMITETRHSLGQHLQKVTDSPRQAFLGEAILCFDAKAYRAAIVLSWVGAANIIQEYIVKYHLTSFNKAGHAKARKSAGGGGKYMYSSIRTTKDFGVIGEAEMLQLCQEAGVLHKSEKQALQERLDMRNKCGHPNPIAVGEHAVAFHIEQLMLNVYSKY